ncbi:MAG: membrane protein insertion efficiency factor YidD [Dethiobacter sp.]|nr:membrane protein insertion efficiency factor YidD [Dethiobacter sp.]
MTLTRMIITLIRFYQKRLSKLTGNCRFYPTCSEYAIIAIKKYGVVKGLKKSVNRLFRCRADNYSSCIDYP